MFLLQLLHELNSTEGKDMVETMKFNWKRICQQLKSDKECTESVEERKVLLKIEKNVYHRKTASPVVITEVCLPHAHAQGVK